ncbi:MAG TPA: hypothetical protein VLB80_03140 [Candidatus Babeliales bacterium]|nr:hypothetical protein [Candidatus Babeliales bacterium]
MIRTSFFITLLILMQTLSCMDASKYNLNTIGNDINDILEHKLHFNVELFSHNTICAVALVNKRLNAFVEKTAQQRKDYLTSQEVYKGACVNFGIDARTTWHKYGSAYAYWIIYTPKVSQERILFNFIHLNGNNSISTHVFEDHHKDLVGAAPPFDDYVPFFNTNGDACMHAYILHRKQQKISLKRSSKEHIVEYSINTNGLQKKLSCYVNIINKNNSNKKNKSINCAKYIDDTVFLKKIINSESITKESIKVYNIDKADMNKNIVLNKK